MPPQRDRMGTIDFDGVRLSCSMSHAWPPIQVIAYGSAEEAKEKLPPAGVQRIAVWEKLCGLLTMDSSKCLGCKFLVRDGVPVSSPPAGRRGISVFARAAAPPRIKR